MFTYSSIPGLETIAAEFDLFLIDPFGILHDGEKRYDGSVQCQIKTQGARQVPQKRRRQIYLTLVSLAIFSHKIFCELAK
jgi:hypothetical protein